MPESFAACRYLVCWSAGWSAGQPAPRAAIAGNSPDGRSKECPAPGKMASGRALQASRGRTRSSVQRRCHGTRSKFGWLRNRGAVPPWAPVSPRVRAQGSCAAATHMAPSVSTHSLLAVDAHHPPIIHGRRGIASWLKKLAMAAASRPRRLLRGARLSPCKPAYGSNTAQVERAAWHPHRLLSEAWDLRACGL